MDLSARLRYAVAAVIVLLMGHPVVVAAQAPASSSPPATPASDSADAYRLDLSGTLFTNFQYGGARGSRSANRFELERAYLTARATLNDRASVRLTADVFQQRDDSRDDFYAGWAFRAKYAYLQYELLKGTSAAGFRANGRLGMLQTVVIDQEEAFWPRWISNVALERAGFFSSADVGAAATLTFPAKLGSVYATVTNGSGYQSRETDRYKDAGVRLTLTPLAGSRRALLQTLSISPWIYKGARGSRFERGVGSLDPVTDARARDRWGVLAAIGGRTLTVGAHIAERNEELDSILVSGGTDSTIATREASARVLSAFGIARPFATLRASPLHPLGLVLRHDAIEDLELGGNREVLIAGLIWEAGPRVALALDYQEQTLRGQPPTASAASVRALDTRVYFLHAVVNF